MQASFAAQLTQALSTDRLSAYQLRTNHNSQLKLFSHYAWNMALSESLYPALQVLEVALRNTIHTNCSQHFQRDDWYDLQHVIRFRNDVDALNKAKQTLKRQQKPLESNRIIAELNFGFWTSLIDRRYEQVLWPALLKSSFPHMPRRIRTRKTLSQRLQKIRRLRNRIFHHEPIWYWKNLSQQHQDILEAITWIEPTAKDLVMAIDRFPDTYQSSLANIEQRLKQFC